VTAPAGPVPVGVIGAGNVSDQYLPTLLSYPDVGGGGGAGRGGAGGLAGVAGRGRG
jgi:hypothetical protein